VIEPLIIDEILERLAAVEALSVSLDQEAPPPDHDVEQSDGAGSVHSRFDDPVEWVDLVLGPLWAGERLPWCARWWQHRDAYERLCWLWRSWEDAITKQEHDTDAMAT